jgi:hypothetical protein
MTQQYKNVVHISQYTIIGTSSIFTAANAIRQLQKSSIEQALFNNHKKVILHVEEQILEIWQQAFYRENH